MIKEEENFLEAVKKLKEEENKKYKKRNFDQTLDLIINLKDFDVRKKAFNLFIQLPNKIKDKKIAGFLEEDNKLIYVIKKDDFGKYKEKKDIKKLVKDYDFFIANAKLMPSIAANFGRVLGPAGKMPSPQLGIIVNEEDNSIKNIIDKINSSVKIMVKEPSIKIGVAKESLDNEKIVQNILAVYRRVIEMLPKKEENVRNVKIKFTMGKPITV